MFMLLMKSQFKVANEISFRIWIDIKLKNSINLSY